MNPYFAKLWPTGLHTPTGASRKIKENLCHSLDAVQAAGCFAAFKTIPSVAPISVLNVGITPFPLTEEYARKLIDKARLAPFGRGPETVVDTSVRNTWELDASWLDFSNNQQWIKTMRAASTWAAKELRKPNPQGLLEGLRATSMDSYATS
ncbi:hypothetical protein DFS34DRAFT_221461 [Phlyctochytrium arcticum]|nr:hypothetical protein DFS34DRAFT_221461 [Phlyctochytrium arcticum]